MANETNIIKTMIENFCVIARSIVEQCDVAIQKTTGFSWIAASFALLIPRNDTKLENSSHLFLFPFSFSLHHFAMTLAEVLITLGIIGLVAAMTIPTLMNNTQDEQFTVGLKKFYSDISQTMVTMQASDSPYTVPSDDTNVNESRIMRDNLCEIMSCAKKDTTTKIWGTSLHASSADNTIYKNYKSSYKVYTDQNDLYAAALLKNGMYIGITHNIESRKGFQLYVDTNGAKGPNMFGKDLNMFEIVHDDNNYYKPVAEGGPGTCANIAANGSTCKAGESSFESVWPCSYYRLYMPDKMP